MTHADLELTPATEGDLDRLGDVLSHGFGFPRDESKMWFERSKLENIRVLRRGGSPIVGGLIEIPMGQYFGGESIPTMGVAGVGITPEERGRGAGAAMMTAMLREARARGFPLSTLYPATISLYRRAGYERAGARFAISLDPRHVEIPRVPEVTVAEVDGLPEAARRLYERTMRKANGYLDRGPYIWERIVKPRGFVTKTFTFTVGQELEGYVVLSHTSAPHALTSVVNVVDMVATTPRAARAILRLVIEYRSIAETVRWHGGVNDVFMNALPERHADIKLLDYFMVRIVDVARALEKRGWPRQGANGTLALDVEDASMPENSGRYVISLDAGQAKVERRDAPSDGALRAKITERGLAALYTGYLTSDVLLASGWLEADAPAAAMLDAWFAGPLPVMRDGF